MKTYRVVFTPDAREDMLEYTRYIAAQEHDDQQALAWYQGIYEVVMGLQQLRHRHSLARENGAFEREVRQVSYKSHRAIYTVDDDASLVVIHRIWHAARENATSDQLPDLR